MDGLLNLEFFYELKLESRKGDGMNVIKFCMDLGLIAKQYICPTCGECMQLCPRRGRIDKFQWVCRKYGQNAHVVTRSLRKDSWFSESKLSMIEILLMTEFFIFDRKQSDVMYELNLCSHTVNDWRSFFRDVCFEFCVNESCVIGGEDVIVEIDESILGKRKYQHRKRVQDQWVYSGIELGTNKCFFRVVEKWDIQSLLDIIKIFILPGTTVVSNCWRSYDCLEAEGFQQLAVNNRIHFKDPGTGARSNSIEGTWAAIKKRSPSKTATDQFDSHLAEYIWRRNHTDSGDLMKTFLSAVIKVYEPMGKD